MVTLPNIIEMALVIAKLEGPAVSQYCTLRILPATLDESLYDLAGELVRFLLRSGREIEHAPTESHTLTSPKLLGFLIFGSSHKKSSLDKRLKLFKLPSTKPHCLPLRWPTEGLYPLVVTPFRHRPGLYPLKLRLFHFLLASSPLFIVGLRPDQAIQTGGGGSPQPPWRDGEVVISLGGFAGVALRRCLRRSGQLLPPPSSLVSSCDRFGALAPLFLKLQKEVGRCPLPLLDSQSKAWQLLEIAMSGLDFTACDGRTRTCRPCFAYPSVEAPSRRSVVPRTVLRLRFSIDPSDFDAAKLYSHPHGCVRTLLVGFLWSSSSFKEQSLHVASVKSILESHASYLMSGKELSSCAQLKNFAAGLELIGQKLQISELQNRLDAEFLPAQMCSVKFKEWIVVLATLLQRSESTNDLLQILEEKLSATPREGSSRVLVFEHNVSLESVQISKADSEPTWLIAVKGRARRDIGLDLINGLIL
ncbi:hypothetical protein F2Q69_00049653 [Brassica cretica]|uniref:Uncharacterized protein n=1 Tax=Brassica cretica TaxID=69181 RepID=A0A8S9PU34_BRACR|nr:hypothetical protein F2Q69_00049653 [Brassica cretica]